MKMSIQCEREGYDAVALAREKRDIPTRQQLKMLFYHLDKTDRSAPGVVGDWSTLHHLVTTILKPMGIVLHYEPASSSSEDYILIIAGQAGLLSLKTIEPWIGIDAKWDACEQAVPLTIIVTKNKKTKVSCTSAYMISNRENQETTMLFIKTVGNNVPCRARCQDWKTIPVGDKGGFRRVTDCTDCIAGIINVSVAPPFFRNFFKNRNVT
jgi:hypothetical protein